MLSRFPPAQQPWLDSYSCFDILYTQDATVWAATHPVRNDRCAKHRLGNSQQARTNELSGNAQVVDWVTPEDVDEASLAHPWAKMYSSTYMLTLMIMHNECLPNTMHTYILHMNMYIYICIYICMYIYMYIYIYISYIYIYIKLYMCVFLGSVSYDLMQSNMSSWDFMGL